MSSEMSKMIEIWESKNFTETKLSLWESNIVEENVKCIGLDEVESKYPCPSTSTLVSGRGEQNDLDDDLIDDNVFQSADENDEQELRVANKKNLELFKVPHVNRKAQ